MPITITEQIKVLIGLQKIDGQIYSLKKELAGFPLLQKKFELDFEKKKAALKVLEDQQKAFQLRQKEKEGELQTKEEKIKKLQSQLYQLKSNKEYTAMELEIKGQKADNSLLEEDILKLLDEVDQVKAKIVKEKALLADEEKRMKEALAQIQKRTSEISLSVSGLEEERKVYLPNVEARLFAQYEKILKNREGMALAAVMNSACGGCHMGLPPQVVNEVQLGDKLIICESCARILYWPE